MKEVSPSKQVVAGSSPAAPTNKALCLCGKPIYHTLYETHEHPPVASNPQNFGSIPAAPVRVAP